MLYLLHSGSDGVLVCHVQPYVVCVDAFASECCRRVSPPLWVARPDNNRHTSPAELAGNREADAPIRARDERDFFVVRMCNHEVLLACLQC